MPKDLFDLATVGARGQDLVSSGCPLEACLEAVGLPTQEFVLDSSKHIVFWVVNNRPDRRVVQIVHHLARSVTLIAVSACRVVVERAGQATTW